jgi:hypothetical protein
VKLRIGFVKKSQADGFSWIGSVCGHGASNIESEWPFLLYPSFFLTIRIIMKELPTLFIAWTFLSLSSFSQTAVYVQARGGVTAGMSRLKDVGEYSRYFRTKFYYGQHTGLAIGLNFPNRLSVEAGYENNEIGIEVIENLKKLVYDTIEGGRRHGIIKGTGFTYHCVPIRFSLGISISNRLIVEPMLGLQLGYHRHSAIYLAGWGGPGYNLRLSKAEHKTSYAMSLQYGGGITWRATNKDRQHPQYLTFLLLHNAGLITNYIDTYTINTLSYGSFQRVVNFKASYLAATVGYRYFLT